MTFLQELYNHNFSNNEYIQKLNMYLVEQEQHQNGKRISVYEQFAELLKKVVVQLEPQYISEENDVAPEYVSIKEAFEIAFKESKENFISSHIQKEFIENIRHIVESEIGYMTMPGEDKDCLLGILNSCKNVKKEKIKSR